MARIVVRDASVSFGVRPVLERVSLQLEEGERVGLLGRNGEGKSTLLKALAGELTLDEGHVEKAPTTRVMMLPQQVPAELAGALSELVGTGLPASERGETAGHRVQRVLSWLEMPADAELGALSGGTRRRVLLARALVRPE